MTAFHLPGTLEQRELETALLWEAGCQAVAQEGDEVVAYFAEPVALPLAGTWREVPETDHVAAYYASLAPVYFDRLVVAPTHCTLPPDEARRVLWLDPGMAFGTGHHATTYLALAQLDALELAGQRVLDVGAGSGILAIAADLLGAAEATGIDIDPLTLSVAEANRTLNDANATFQIGTLDDVSDTFDLVTANLYAELHAELAADYARVLRLGGRLLVTGILNERLALVEDTLAQAFEVYEVQRLAAWALIAARRT